MLLTMQKYRVPFIQVITSALEDAGNDILSWVPENKEGDMSDGLDASQTNKTQRLLTRYTFLSVLFWTAIVSGSLSWNILKEGEQSRTLAKQSALAYFNKDLAFRLWASLHGGVYVPVTERTPPNPYLKHIPDRDLTTPSGLQLTLMNPAYMMRQVMEGFSELYGVRGHITSLKPLRPENAPDDWERSALSAFEQGETEAFEFIETNGEELLRLMRPLVTEKGCLKCHADQGYQEGDVRGGVGVTVSMAKFRNTESRAVNGLLWSHGILWGLGLGGMVFVFVQSKRQALERHKAANVLIRHNHFINSIMNGPADLIVFALDTGYRYTAFNNNHLKEMRKIYHVEIEVGMSALEYIAISDVREKMKSSFDRVLQGEAFTEVQMQSEQNTYYKFNWNPIVSENGSVEGLTVFIQDVTDQTLAEREVRGLNARLEARVRQRTSELESVNKELQHFAYIVSHDLKAPLRGISRLAHWLVKDAPECFDDAGKEMSRLLINRVTRLDNLIEALLDYSRVGRFVGESSEVDLNRLVREVIDMLAPPAHIQFRFDNELPTIRGDKIRLQQMFQRLVDNAITFMDKSEGLVTIGSVDEDSHWLFSVTDNGPGIDAKYHHKIFQVFQTLQPRDEHESMGIGLALVKKIVEFHKGNVWVESEVGKGSSFLFTIAKQQDHSGGIRARSG